MLHRPCKGDAEHPFIILGSDGQAPILESQFLMKIGRDKNLSHPGYGCKPMAEISKTRMTCSAGRVSKFFPDYCMWYHSLSVQDLERQGSYVAKYPPHKVVWLHLELTGF